MFMLRTAEYLIRDLRLDFDLGTILGYERDRMIVELLDGKLLDD